MIEVRSLIGCGSSAFMIEFGVKGLGSMFKVSAWGVGTGFGLWRCKGAHGEPEVGSVSMIHSPCDDMRSMGAAELRAVGLRTQAVTVCWGWRRRPRG